MKIITLSLVVLGAASLVSCEQFKKSNPYGAPTAAAPGAATQNPYAVPQANGETNAYGGQQAPYQQIPGVSNTLPPTQPPAVNHDYMPDIPSAQPAAAAGSTLPYTVQSGDSLWKISRDFKTSVQSIQEANGITGTNIQAGQVLQIPNN